MSHRVGVEIQMALKLETVAAGGNDMLGRKHH